MLYATSYILKVIYYLTLNKKKFQYFNNIYSYKGCIAIFYQKISKKKANLYLAFCKVIKIS